MTIRQAINSGSLPNLDEKLYVSVCNYLKINATDLDYELKSGELERLRYNGFINSLYITDRVKKSHDKLIGNYDKLIKKYEKVSTEMTDPSLAEEKARIDELLGRLRIAKTDYEVQAQGVDIDLENMNLDHKVLNGLQEKRLASLDERQNKVDDKLQAEYEALEALQSASFSSKFKQRRNEREIKKVQDRIKRLQQKQGRLQSTQQRIINRGTEKYKKIKQEELNDHEQLLNNKKQQVDYKKDMELNEQLISTFSSKPGIFNKFKVARLERDQKKMERRLNSLKSKEEVLEYLAKSGKDIKCKDFGAQFFRTVAKSYAYAR